MTDFDSFEGSLYGIPRDELVQMLYKLSSTWERIAMVGLHPDKRGEVARAVLDMAKGG